MNQHIADGQLALLEIPTPYVSDPLTLFAKLTDYGQRKRTLLLESAEIDSKADTKSLMILDSALSLHCSGRTVTITAHTANGESVLPWLYTQLQTQAELSQQGNQLTALFPQPEANLDEEARLKASSPLAAIRSLLNQISPINGTADGIFVGGVFAYDLIASFEPLPEVKESVNQTPDYLFYVAETLLMVDHQRRQCRLLAAVFGGEHATPSYFDASRKLSEYKTRIEEPSHDGAFAQGEVAIADEVRVDVSDEAFGQQVEQLKGNIVKGDIFQVVPSRTFSVNCPDPLLAYQCLKLSNPSPYMFYLNDEQFVLFGASPESALKYDAASNQVEIYPIAGTRRRGMNADGSINRDLDSRIELQLRQDQKELSEHLMLVDLARNDVARISQAGTRHVADLLKVDRYSHVMHLVSRVVGQLHSDLDCLHAYQACMNMGTLTGAPKIRASQLIREVEQQRRGSYGGAVGYMNSKGDMDTCIVIRSAFVSQGRAYIQAGAGVVHDSHPQSEADETTNKAQAVVSAVKRANQLLREKQHG